MRDDARGRATRTTRRAVRRPGMGRDGVGTTTRDARGRRGDADANARMGDSRRARASRITHPRVRVRVSASSSRVARRRPDAVPTHSRPSDRPPRRSRRPPARVVAHTSRLRRASAIARARAPSSVVLRDAASCVRSSRDLLPSSRSRAGSAIVSANPRASRTVASLASRVARARASRARDRDVATSRTARSCMKRRTLLRTLRRGRSVCDDRPVS